MDMEKKNLTELRNEIDITDDLILELFIKRMQLVSAVAEFKIKNNIATLDSSREQAILDHVAAKSASFAPYSTELFKTMMKLSRDYQNAQRRHFQK